MLIQTRDLVKTYRTDEVVTTALNSVNIDIEAGEFIAVMGPSGCGKSTLLNVLGMLDSPDSGSYRFRGEELAGHSESGLASVRKRHVGFIFQSFNLIDELTVRENIELGLLYHSVSSRDRASRTQQAMEAVGIAHRASHMPGQLSGGQQQRVAVARAVVSRPAVILADEPTGNLDSKNGEEVMALLQQLNRDGTTVIMVTHSPSHSRYARRTINLLDGEVVTEDLRAVV